MKADPSFSELEAKWIAATQSIPGYTASDWFEAWKTLVSQSLHTRFRRKDIFQIPSECIELHFGADPASLEHLWIRTLGHDGDSMNLGRSRRLLDVLLLERSLMRLSSEEYSEWLKEFLNLLCADQETGSVSKNNFLRLFALWYSSRIWFIPSRRTPIEEILHSWEYVDVSGSGVVSAERLSRTLLPFAFRVIYSNSGEDDTALKIVWIERMFACVSCRKADWENHWTEFSNLDLLSFSDVLMNKEQREVVATHALRYFNIEYSAQIFEELESLFAISETTSSKQQKSRLFSLWLVTLKHGIDKYSASKSPIEPMIEAIPVIRSRAAFRAMCWDVWASYISPPRVRVEDAKTFFNDWLEKMIDTHSLESSEETVLVLRDKFVERFVPDSDVERLWPVDATSRITPDQLMNLLIGVHKSLQPLNGNCQGPWIIETWIHHFLVLAMHASGTIRAEITRSAFRSVFPLFFASLRIQTSVGKHVFDSNFSWLKSDAHKLIYSKPHLCNLLREVWDKSVPAELNLVCQEWWVDRCTEVFEEFGKGVSRKSFFDLFMTREETCAILASINKLDERTMARLLTNAVLEGKDADGFIPADWVAEYFMIADLDMRSSALHTDQFEFAFPLWLASHSRLAE